MTGNDVSAVSNNTKLFNMTLASKEEDGMKALSGKDDVVNAGIVATSTKPTVGFKDKAKKSSHEKISMGIKDNMNLDSNDNDK